MSSLGGPSSGPSAGPSTSLSMASAGGKPDRLFVGNLAPTVDEFTLIKVFEKYGKITKLDFMFHRSGVLKGKPRGYAFLEFSNKDDALKAMVKLHDRLLRGRKLVVTYASSAPINELQPIMNKGRRPTEAAKTTTLSLLKANRSRRPPNTAAQIAAMEAKLATMAKTKPPDEDYIPGSSRLAPPRGSGSVSGSASPCSGAEADEEMHDVLGDEEGAKAANELQREIDAELEELDKANGDRAPVIPTPDVAQAESSVEAKGDDQSRSELAGETSTSSPQKGPLTGIAGLPPRPAAVATRAPSAAEHRRSDRDTTRTAEIKRGLAGLPKKPAF